MKIFIVYGYTGEYEDRSEWLVKAFTDENKAKDMISQLAEISRCLLMEGDKHHHILTLALGGSIFVPVRNSKVFDHIISNSGILDLDPNFYMDYTGTSYGIKELELDDKEPELYIGPV